MPKNIYGMGGSLQIFFCVKVCDTKKSLTSGTYIKDPNLATGPQIQIGNYLHMLADRKCVSIIFPGLGADPD